MDGLDTSFFFAFKEGRKEAIDLYRDITAHGRQAAVSTVTIFELLRHRYAGRLDRDFVEEAVESVGVAFQRAGIDEQQVLRRAARMAHGMGLAMADAMIAASLEHIECERLYTRDHDFEAYDGPMQIVFYKGEHGSFDAVCLRRKGLVRSEPEVQLPL